MPTRANSVSRKLLSAGFTLVDAAEPIRVGAGTPAGQAAADTGMSSSKKSRPIPFIVQKKSDPTKYELGEQAVTMLRGLTGRIALIAVAGVSARAPALPPPDIHT